MPADATAAPIPRSILAEEPNRCLRLAPEAQSLRDGVPDPVRRAVLAAGHSPRGSAGAG